jgi:hypothetical protein
MAPSQHPECNRTNRLCARGVVLAVFGCAIALGSCQGGADSVRASLAAQQSSWQREIGTLKNQRAALQARVLGQGIPARRAQTMLTGLGQSIADVEVQIRQAGPRVERAIDRNADASKALEEEAGRIGSYLQGLSADLTSVARELDGPAQGQQKARAEAE